MQLVYRLVDSATSGSWISVVTVRTAAAGFEFAPKSSRLDMRLPENLLHRCRTPVQWRRHPRLERAIPTAS